MEWLNDALAQRKLLAYFTIGFLYILGGFLESKVGIWVLFLAIAAYQAKLIFEAHCLLKGACTSTSWVLAVLSFIPCLGILIMYVLYAACTGVLEAAGVKSGMFGVSSEVIAEARKMSLKKNP